MRYAKAGVIRAVIPFTIMTTIAIFLAYGDNTPEDARSTFIVGLIIAAVAGFSVIYDVEQWSLARQSAIHFACMVATVLPCLFASGWFETGSAADISHILLIFLACGVVFWGVSYVVFGRLLNR